MKEELVDSARDLMDGSLINLITGLGMAKYDRTVSNLWMSQRPPDYYDLQNKYRGSWMATQCITIPVEDALREWRVFEGQEENRDMIEAYEEQYKIKHLVKEGLWQGRLFGVMYLMAVTQRRDEKSLRNPLTPSEKVERLILLDRLQLTPSGAIDTDPMSENFMRPTSYLLNGRLLVDASRIIRFPGRPTTRIAYITNQYTDDSYLTGVMPAIEAYETGLASISNAIHDASIDVIKIPQLRELLGSSDSAEKTKVANRIQAAMLGKSTFRTLLLDGSEEYVKKESTSFKSIADVLEKLAEPVAGATDIPVSRLFGRQALGMSSDEGSMRNYFNMIRSLQNVVVRPILKRIDQMLGVIPDDWTFEFPELFIPSGAEAANTEKTEVDTDVALLDKNIVTSDVLISKWGKKRFGLTQEEITAMQEAESVRAEREMELAIMAEKNQQQQQEQEKQQQATTPPTSP